MATVAVTHFSDPGCPWAYSVSPALAVLRWRYGDQLEWRLVTIGLAEDPQRYVDNGYTPTRMTVGNLGFRRYGMPFGAEPRARVAGTGRACRAIVATRLRDPGREHDVLRALQLGWFTSTLCSTRTPRSPRRCRASTASTRRRSSRRSTTRRRSPPTSRTRRSTRSAAGGPTEFQGKARQTDGPVRFSAPSLVFECDGRRMEAGGFQTIEAYDVLIANLDAGLSCAAGPRRTPPRRSRRSPAGSSARRSPRSWRRTTRRPIATRPSARSSSSSAPAGSGARRWATTPCGSPLERRALASPSSPTRSRGGRVACTAEMTLTVTLPDGTALELADGATGADAAAAIGPGLARAALAVEVSHPEAGEGPQLRDLSRALPAGASLAIVTKSDGDKALELIRHDTAHVLAEAVLELYEGVKISIGPPIADGFYYDFQFPDGVGISEADFPAIEARMRAHVKAAEPFERREATPGEARERFAAEGQDYKVELIDDLVAQAAHAHPPRALESVSLYTNGPFTDLCRGPHAPSTKSVGAFRLQSVAGAYWRGDSQRTMLTRIYGTAFFTNDELSEHLERIEQAKARDHRKLGRELGLFTFSELSPGSPFWKPAGMAIWNSLTELWRRENLARGYREVKTPILYDVDLWKQSGHWDKYKDNMYFTDVEDRPMGLKPMNCPAHIQIYNDERHSYRDLPVRYSEAGLVHRHEASGVLHGLLRVRHITQDDAHIFCTDEQVESEVVQCLRFGFDLYRLFDLEPRLELSTRPEQRIG